MRDLRTESPMVGSQDSPPRKVVFQPFLRGSQRGQETRPRAPSLQVEEAGSNPTCPPSAFWASPHPAPSFSLSCCLFQKTAQGAPFRTPPSLSSTFRPQPPSAGRPPFAGPLAAFPWSCQRLGGTEDNPVTIFTLSICFTRDLHRATQWPFLPPGIPPLAHIWAWIYFSHKLSVKRDREKWVEESGGRLKREEPGWVDQLPPGWACCLSLWTEFPHCLKS